MSHQRTTAQADLEMFTKSVSHLHAGWTLWRRLFHPDENHYADNLDRWHADCDEARRVLNNASPFAFGQIGWLMMQSIVLGVLRLCDPQETGGKTNLTVERLINDLAKTHPTTGASIGNSLPSVRLAHVCASRLLADEGLRRMRDIRNKVIAHNDLAAARNPEELPGVDLAALHDNIRSLVTLCHALKNLDATPPITPADANYQPSFGEEREWVEQGANVLELIARGLERIDGKC